MNIAQIEQNLQNLIQNFTKETFIFELLLAYGSPKASITRLQKGNLNLSKIEGEISWKKKVFFKPVFNQDLHLAISEIKNTLKQEQRFVIVTDFKTLLAIDTKTSDSLDIDFTALPKHFDFFLPWAGMEKAQHQNENPADVKAAGKMAKLFEEIKKDNPENSKEFTHGLNVFLSRLLFCYFAEDTGIFNLGQFSNAIASHTQTDGSDLSDYLNKLFEVLNTNNKDRKNLPAYLLDFPYVNGGLFTADELILVFTRRSRQAVIDAGQMDWSAINPDIFGSMFQDVISVEQRGNLGQHYTSVPNIMKVIEPLFLNELKVEFENAKGSIKKLNALLIRLQNIKIFDPACGSGNFLIIAYKELRRVEIVVLAEIQTLKGTAGSGSLDFGSNYHSVISLNNFYGIEIDDFAYEIAKLALWLAEHQMNSEFYNTFGSTTPTLPLTDAGQITCGNATRLDWETVCPKNDNDEIYILGNPPYLGSNYQSSLQKEDLQLCFNGVKGVKNLDYISCWFVLASKYIKNTKHKSAFVSTNSICQGEQVSMLWPIIFNNNVEIYFAYKSFKWTNSARDKAGVTVIIVGLKDFETNFLKLIYETKSVITAQNISPYLIDSPNLIIEKRLRPLSNLAEMSFGSKLVDGGNLILSNEEKEKLLELFPTVNQYLRKLIGADEYVKGYFRWCLWLKDDNVNEAMKIPFFEDRIKKVKDFRLSSKKKATIDCAKKPHRFGEVRYYERPSIIVPRVTSERREYLTCGYLEPDCVILDRAQAIFDAEPWVLSLLSSKIHMVWAGTFAGRLETRLNYSSSLCYNTFPFPSITTQQKQEITQCVLRILEERENHSEKTLAQLYDPEKMPEGLREAHRLNDLAVERCYRSKPFESDEERLEYLFKLYEKMITEEKEKGTLFQEEKKAKKLK